MTNRDFFQHSWNDQAAAEALRLTRETLEEDLDQAGDITSLALVPPEAMGSALLVAREAGIIAGLPIGQIVIDEVDSRLKWTSFLSDGDSVEPGTKIARISGPVQVMLTAERPILNMIGRLSGIASLTAQYWQAITGTGAKIYDTRKTTPGWRYLEKYAVHCGGGQNHRTGLFDAMLIKDNHLACVGQEGLSPRAAVERGRKWLEERYSQETRPLIEIEVDSLEQLRILLPAHPDIVLLDNMSPETMREAVLIRNQLAPSTELEASGGINLETVRAKALSGVERVSVGRLTHSPRTLDIGLDWEEA